MSDHDKAANAAAQSILNELITAEGPAGVAGRLKPEFREATASRLREELGGTLTLDTARRWFRLFEGIAPDRFIPGAPNLPLKPVHKMSADERLAVGNWLSAQRAARVPITKPQARLPDELRNAPAEVRNNWCNKQAWKG